MKYKPLIPFILIILSCKNEKLINNNWKYQEGHHIGDWLDFKTSLNVSNDTIYKDSIAIAKFIKINKGYFGFPTRLKIADFKTNKIGTYIAK